MSAVNIGNLRTDAGRVGVGIAGGRITHLGKLDASSTLNLDGAGCWLLPGLINAHDHLALDLLPPLGNPPYCNSVEWAKDVYHPERSPIREVWHLHHRERLLWGAYRNLLSGVTTVQHHDRGHWRLSSLPVRVPPYRWLHGVDSTLGGHYRPCRTTPLFIHCGEGTDEASYGEVSRLAEVGLLGAQTRLVHAIAIDTPAIEMIARSGAGVVLCPASNQFLYGQTAPISALQKAGVPLALGTDSTATGSTDLLAELRSARGIVDDAELFSMVTSGGAKLLGVPELGKLSVGGPADLLLLDRPKASNTVEALLTARPEHVRLVVVRGKPALVRPPFEPLKSRLQAVRIDGHITWLTGLIASLLKRTHQLLGQRLYFGQAIEPL